MFLSTQKIQYTNSLKISGGELSYSKQIKYLGLLMEEALSWECHIDNIRKKIRAPIGILKKKPYYAEKIFETTLFFTYLLSPPIPGGNMVSHEKETHQATYDFTKQGNKKLVWFT